MDLFAKIVNDLEMINYFPKSFILDSWQGSEYASAEYKVNCSPILARC